MQPQMVKALLLVDSPNYLDVTRDKLTLSRLDIKQVVLAKTLAEALQAIGANCFDIVLLHINLDDTRSSTVIKTVRAATDAAIIAITDSEDELRAIDALREGADSYILRCEMTPELLKTSIENSLNRHEIRKITQAIQTKLDQLPGE